MTTPTHNGMNTEAHPNREDVEFRALPNPMINDASPFFRAAGAQLEAASRARTADELIQLLNSAPGACAPSAGDAFYPGCSSDYELDEFLQGWEIDYIEAPYFWKATAPDGSRIEYIEGDVRKV
ncbi:hypothetical protein NQ011_10890 [Corynebacterium phoceense]|uniref:hypothetical protein n=1 Tax=Corynebacterium phoceense TaxID=1686286 RepID=UPI00211BF44E|nr:hypothetical protein [Corynebacterium phoceense]MCQ9337180.1 hypothetical protein [Corynebacterium phoceense]